MGILSRELKQSTLPKYLELNTVRDLCEADGWKYVTPWSILVDEEGRMWISKGSSFYDYGEGTAHTAIKVKNSGIVLVKENTIQDHRFHRTQLNTQERDYFPICLV